MIYHDINIPVYIQLKNMFIEKIENKELQPGDELPGERMIAEEYEVSRVTVRKCIGCLVEEGYLKRSRGKRTIVAAKKVNHHLGKLIGIREEIMNDDGTVTIDVLSQGFIPASSVVKKNLSTDDTRVFLFSRRMYKNDVPIVINDSYASYEVGKLIAELDLKHDIVLRHLEQCGYQIKYAEQTMTPGLCSEEEAKLLNYEIGKPVMIVVRTTCTENGYPVLYEKSIYRGDIYEYSIKLVR